MMRALRSLVDGYRRIAVWTLRIVIALGAFAGLAFVIVWPLWTIATSAPALYAAIVGALFLGAVLYALFRRGTRRESAGTRPRRTGHRLLRLGAGLGTALAAYAALALFQLGAVFMGIVFAAAAVVLLGVAGRRIDHS
jgi:hypothetical protein